MSENNYWFKNPLILFQNMKDFFPRQDLSNVDKVNALARLSIYYSILIIILKLDTKYLSLSVCLLFLSFLLGGSESFISSDPKKCTRPTKENPFMNFTVGDHIINPNKPPACPLDNIRDEQIKNYRFNMIVDPIDLYGKTITDRNFYTLPSTTIVNDQEGFLKYLYGDFGKCKSEGKDCLKHRDNRFARGRYYYQY